MRILWLCNLILPAVAKELGLEASNKEGWVVGLAEKVLNNQKDGEVTFAIAAPVPASVLAPGEDYVEREFDVLRSAVSQLDQDTADGILKRLRKQ